jgi:type VI secretion system secreted protein VgrG
MKDSYRIGTLYRRFSFSVTGLPKHEFEVVRFDGEEALSTLYRFELLLASTDSNIDETSLIAKAAQFCLNDGVEGGRSTVYRGLVRSIVYLYQIGEWAFYRVILVPKMWLLDTFFLSEIYLNKTRPEIYSIIMNSAGFTPQDFDVRNKDKPDYLPRREFVCQYQESYFNFIARWLERLGVYWWYEDIDGHEKIVFGDTRFAHKDEALLLHYHPPGELDAIIVQKRRLQSLELEICALPKKIVIRDYSAQRASMEIQGSAIVDPNGNGEVHIFGEHLKSNDEAARFVALRTEGYRCRNKIYRGSTTATGVRCGEFVEIQDHPRQRFNLRYLVTSVKHQGSQVGLLLYGLDVPVMNNTAASRADDFYQAEFTAIPSDVQFRPEITHPWPKIEGTVTGFVDAEGNGQYAELNEAGEYKIQVPFDITEKNAQRGSAWIRMASPYAGNGYGLHFPLLKGTEVLVSFINGNPDEPVIVGAVHNSMNPNVVNNINQMQSRIRTAGGNEVVLHDEASKPCMLFKTPTGNTWLRMGSGGSDPTSTNQLGSLNTRQSLTQIQSGTQSDSDDLSDGTYDFTGDSVDGLTINTDGQLTLAAAGNVSITSSDDVIITSNNKTTIANGDSSDTTHGNTVEWIVGTKTEGVLGAWQELGTAKFEAYATNIKALGLSVSVYGFAFNVYASYINYYNFRLDNAAVRIDKAAVRLKGDAMSLNNVGIGIFQSSATVENKLAEFLDKGVKIETVGEMINSAVMKLDDHDIEIIELVTGVSDRLVTVESNMIKFLTGTIVAT